MPDLLTVPYVAATSSFQEQRNISDVFPGICGKILNLLKPFKAMKATLLNKNMSELYSEPCQISKVVFLRK